LRGERPFSTKPSECFVAWKLGIASGFDPDFGHDWKSTKFLHECSQMVQQVFTGTCGGEFVWLEPCFFDSIAPPYPKLPPPV
jgi:hypothetical protein